MDKDVTPMDYFFKYNFNAQVTEDGNITKQFIKCNDLLIDHQFYSWFEAVCNCLAFRYWKNELIEAWWRTPYCGFFNFKFEQCFHSDFEVRNFPLEERSKEELETLEEVLQLKRTADLQVQIMIFSVGILSLFYLVTFIRPIFLL